jgi:Zn-dependent protease
VNLATAIVFLPGLVIGLTFHEFAHAWSASLLGDDFARRQGRVSLNPCRHLTPLGTLAILFLPFGWGRPVPVNLYNFSRPRRDYLVTSLAGPLANLLLAAICLGLMHFFLHPFRFDGWQQSAMRWTYRFLEFAVMINAMLAVLNLLPIPPLDGSKIWPCVLPHAKAAVGSKNSMFFLIVLAVLLSTHTLDPILGGAMRQIVRLMPHSDAAYVEVYQEVGRRLLDEGRWLEAETILTQALAIQPRNDDLLSYRARARLGLKKYSEALSDITEAISIRPLPERSQIRAKIVGGEDQGPGVGVVPTEPGKEEQPPADPTLRR